MATATVNGSFLAAARQFTENLYHCSRCNYCVEASWEEKGLRHICPTLIHHSPALSYSGKGYLATARALADGEELSAATVADRVFACTTCGNCEEACPIGLQPAQLVKAMRADLVDHGLAPDSAPDLIDMVGDRACHRRMGQKGCAATGYRGGEGRLAPQNPNRPRGEVAHEALGEEVVAHYLNAADVELEAFGAAVTDWERVRGFERL